MTNIKQALVSAREQLKASSASFSLDCEVLLCHALKVTKAYLYTYPEKTLTEAQLLNFQELVNSRQAGMPIAYLTGKQEFWSLDLNVNPATLIPRADTELLVSKTLENLANIASPSILELGTGSGAISLAIANSRPDIDIIATDISQEALKVATNNAKELAITNIKFVLSNWYSEVGDKKFDAIISNPPYIEADDPHLQQGDVRFEPKNALISGSDGLESLTNIISNAKKHLKEGGHILVEHGYNQSLDVKQLLADNGFEDLSCWQDLAGNDRVSYGHS